MNYHDDTELMIFADDMFYQKCKITTARINEDEDGIYEVDPAEYLASTGEVATEIVLVICR